VSNLTLDKRQLATFKRLAPQKGWSLPRLFDQLPEEFARNCVRSAVGVANLYRVLLEGTYTLWDKLEPDEDDLPYTRLFEAARQVCDYAQGGETPLEEAKKSFGAMQIGMRTMGDDTTETDVFLEGEPLTLAGVVMIAAEGRAMLEMGHPALTRCVAALAELPAATVERKVSTGELVRAGRTTKLVMPDSARRWLASRGVRGFEGPGQPRKPHPRAGLPPSDKIYPRLGTIGLVGG
jgi:hypothetical protein